MLIPSATVYGVLLNDRDSIRRLADQFGSDPYKAPPKAPILYIKPANTWRSGGATVNIPSRPGNVQIGASIGAVIGKSATRIESQAARSHISGFRVVADVSLPHEIFYRPAIRERCRDGFCPMGPLVSTVEFNAQDAAITVSVNGATVQTHTLSNSVRPLERLLADISAFMTLQEGDMLLLGLADHQPKALPGDDIRIDVAGLGDLDFRLSLENEEAPT